MVDLNKENQIVDNEECVSEKLKTETLEDMEDKKETIKSIVWLVVFILIIVGGLASGYVRCTNCGADDTRFFVYASGTSSNGVEYKSCVGPAGCLGFGINSKCWPTECVSVKKDSLSGCVTYYNEAGCIANSGVKSEGKYSDQFSCLGIGCAGHKYIETVAESTQAKSQTTCLGIGCGNATATTSKEYNTKMPRQFIKGCWSAD